MILVLNHRQVIIIPAWRPHPTAPDHAPHTPTTNKTSTTANSNPPPKTNSIPSVRIKRSLCWSSPKWAAGSMIVCWPRELIGWRGGGRGGYRAKTKAYWNLRPIGLSSRKRRRRSIRRRKLGCSKRSASIWSPTVRIIRMWPLDLNRSFPKKRILWWHARKSQ